MSDAIDGGMDSVNDEEEAGKIYSQICDEIGVELNEEYQVNNQKVSAPAQQVSTFYSHL